MQILNTTTDGAYAISLWRDGGDFLIGLMNDGNEDPEAVLLLDEALCIEGAKSAYKDAVVWMQSDAFRQLIADSRLDGEDPNWDLLVESYEYSAVSGERQEAEVVEARKNKAEREELEKLPNFGMF